MEPESTLVQLNNPTKSRPLEPQLSTAPALRLRPLSLAPPKLRRQIADLVTTQSISRLV